MLDSTFVNEQQHSDGDTTSAAVPQDTEQCNGKSAAEIGAASPVEAAEMSADATMPPPQGGPAEPAPALEVVTLEKYQEALKAKDELLDLLLRRQSEFENLRRRTEREKSEYFEFAHANIIKGLLPILDGLERSLSAPEGNTIENFRMGIFLLLKQLRDILEAAGLQVILTKGQQFDPNMHHAVLKEETFDYPDNQIIEEYQRGYVFKDRLLRPSMVKVAVPAVAKPVQAEVEPPQPGQASESDAPAGQAAPPLGQESESELD
jgi:molecular chaperone GrpE